MRHTSHMSILLGKHSREYSVFIFEIVYRAPPWLKLAFRRRGKRIAMVVGGTRHRPSIIMAFTIFQISIFESVPSTLRLPCGQHAWSQVCFHYLSRLQA